jgi:hypothetical protein
MSRVGLFLCEDICVCVRLYVSLQRDFRACRPVAGSLG